jgi:hypothetical protein
MKKSEVLLAIEKLKKAYQSLNEAILFTKDDLD